MPKTPVRCPECDAPLKLADTPAGKKVRCPRCKAAVPASPAPSRNQLLVVLGVLAALVLVCSGVSVALIYAGVIGQLAPGTPDPRANGKPPFKDKPIDTGEGAPISGPIELPRRDEAEEKKRAAQRDEAILRMKANDRRVIEALTRGGDERTDRFHRVWRGTGSRLATLRALPHHQRAALSPDGRYVADADQAGEIVVWDLWSAKVLHCLEGRQRGLTSLAFTPDGATLATASREEAVRLLDVASGAMKATSLVPASELDFAIFSRDAKRLATVRPDGTVNVYDVAEGKLLSRCKTARSGGRFEVAFSPNGQMLATSFQVGPVQLWEVATGRPFAVIVELPPAHGLAFSPDGWTLAVAEWGLAEQQKVLVCDLATGQVQELKGHEGAITSLAFSPDGKLLAAGSPYGRLIMWEWPGLKIVHQSKDIVSGLAFSPGGELLFSADLAFYRVADLLDARLTAAVRAARDLGEFENRGGTYHLRLKDKSTDADLARLKAVAGLASLDMTLQGGVTDAGMAHLGALPDLRRLDLPHTKVNDKGLAHLGKMSRLEALDLTGVEVSDAGLAELKGLQALAELKLSGTKVTRAGMRTLKGMKALRVLNLDSREIGDEGLADLTGLTQLTDLDLNGNAITDAGLTHLKDMQRLRSLNLGANFAMKGEGLVVLKGMKELRELRLGNTDLGDGGLAHLAGLTGMRRLELRGTKVSAEGLSAVKGLTRLEVLSLPDNVGDGGLAHLAGLTDLRELDFGGGTGVTGTGLAHLSKLENVRKWDLSAASIDDAALRHTIGWTQAEELHLPPSIGDDGLKHLETLVNLEVVRLNQSKVTDAGLKHLAKLTKLRRLDLAGTKVTDTGVEAIKKAIPDVTAVK